MDSSERTYSKSEIRERRRAMERSLALQQRQLDALAKMDEAADELEQVEREMEALSRGEAQADQPVEQADQPVETVPREPQAIGKRTLTVLMDQPDTWLGVRDVFADMEKRGWIDGDQRLVLHRLRHCLPRLVNSNDHVERNAEGVAHLYRYRSHLDSYLLTPVPQANGAARLALQGGASDD